MAHGTASTVPVDGAALSEAPGRATAEAIERSLVTRAKEGSAEAREELARRLGRPAYLLALQLARDPEVAREVAQEALLRFFGTLGRFRDGRPPRPWLMRIVRNRVRDLERRRRVRRSWDVPEAAEDALATVAAPIDDPERVAQRRELQRRVWRALAELGVDQREIVVLRDYQDLSYGEIAGVLGVPIGTVMSRLHRARAALRRRLAGPAGHRPAATSETARPEEGRDDARALPT